MSDPLLKIKGLADVEMTIQPEVTAQRDALLAESRAVTVVTDPFEYDVAVETVKKTKLYLREFEAARKEVKKPIDEFVARIQSTAKEHVAEVVAENERVGKLIVSYEDAEARKRAEAERKAREEAEKIKRELAEKEAARIKQESEGRTGTLVEDLNKERDEAAHKLAAVQQQVANTTPPKAAGLRRTRTLKFRVVDVQAMLAARPDLFSPDDVKIRAALKLTRDIPGLEVTEEVKV